MELTPLIDERSDIPLYEQLYLYLKEELKAGRIPANTRLPSIRALSARLGVSRTPVELAYQQLLAEGFLQSRPRSGLYAAKLDEYAVPADMVRATDAADPPSPPRIGAVATAAAIDFGYRRVDVEHFPFRVWQKLLLQTLEPGNRHLFQYGELQGELGLRAEVARYLREVRGVVCRPEQLVIGAGTYHSLDLLCQLLKEECPVIAAERAVNDGVKAAFRGFGFRLVPAELEEDGIRVSDVEQSGARAVYVTPSHQFPYGMTMPIGKRLQLLGWAARTGGYIIENDYDGEFRYGTRPIPALQGLDEHGRVIYIGTFSRALTPSFRISCLVLPESLLTRFRQGGHYFDQLASAIHQEALARFMQSGGFERHMRRMRRHYARKHDLLLKLVDAAMGGRVTVHGAGSGLHVLLEVPEAPSEAWLIEAARAAGVIVYPTSAYELVPGTPRPPAVLLGFGGSSEAELRAGVPRLAAAWFGAGG